MTYPMICDHNLKKKGQNISKTFNFAFCHSSFNVVKLLVVLLIIKPFVPINLFKKVELLFPVMFFIQNQGTPLLRELFFVTIRALGHLMTT